MTVFIVLMVTLVAAPTLAYAHTPHDEIEVVRLSRAFWSDGAMFAIARDSLMATFDAGMTWRRLARGLPYARIRALALSGYVTRTGRVVAATDSSIYFSDDAGSSWKPASIVGAEFPAPPLRLRQASYRPLVRLESDSNPQSSSMLCVIDDSVLVSVDRGATWRPIDVGIGGCRALCVAESKGFAAGKDGVIVAFSIQSAGVEITDRFQLGVSAPITALAAYRHEDVIVGTLGDGVWRARPGLAPLPLGPRGARITGVCSPAMSTGSGRVEGGGLFVTEWKQGVYVSRDDGGHWERRSRGLSRDAQAEEADFRVPHFKSIDGLEHADGRRILVVAGFDGLFQSLDDGATWCEHHNLITRNIVVGLALSEADANARQLVVSLYGGGVHLVRSQPGATVNSHALLDRGRTFAIGRPPTSPSGGKTWVAMHDTVCVVADEGRKIANAPLTAVATQRRRLRSRLRRVLASPAKRLLSHAPPNVRSALRVFLQRRASDVGLELGVDVFGSMFRLSPSFQEDGTAFLSTWRRGLFRSTDGGRSFRHVGAPPSGAWTLSVDLSPGFARNGRLYIGADDGLWMVSRRGEAWSRRAEPAWGGEVLRVTTCRTSADADLLFAATPRGLMRARITPSNDLTTLEQVLACRRGFWVTDVVVAPDFSRSGIVLVHQVGVGMLRSADGGSSFAPVQFENRDFDDHCAHLPGFPDAAPLIAFSPGFETDGVAYAASGTELRISRDRGATWSLWHRFASM